MISAPYRNHFLAGQFQINFGFWAVKDKNMISEEYVK
jgi:hypothetical protein